MGKRGGPLKRGAGQGFRRDLRARAGARAVGATHDHRRGSESGLGKTETEFESLRNIQNKSSQHRVASLRRNL